MTQSELTKWLLNHHACGESLTWLDAQPDLTPQELWESCPRGDWLAWALREVGLVVPDSALRVCDEACVSAVRARDEARASAYWAYDEACVSAYWAYDEAGAPTRRAYYEACASAYRAYDEACASAHRAYAVAIRAEVSFADVMKGCGA